MYTGYMCYALYVGGVTLSLCITELPQSSLGESMPASQARQTVPMEPQGPSEAVESVAGAAEGALQEAPRPHTLMPPAVASSKEAESELTEFLVGKCGVCHSGEARVVKDFEVTNYADLCRLKYVTPGVPEESKVWKMVSARSMPPAKWGAMTRENRDRLRQLILDLKKPMHHDVSVAQATNSLPNIIETGQSDARLSKFLAWARKNGLVVELLEEPGPFTILAPTNEAIVELGRDNLRYLDEQPGALRNVLLNHGCIGTSLTVSELVRRGHVRTNEKYAVTKKDDGIWIGPAKIVQADIRCSNGVIHLIDRALVPLRVSEEFPESNLISAPAGIQMALVRGGTFQMGSPSDEEHRHDDEGPLHNVRLDPFLIGNREVTRRQYHGIMFLDPADKNMPGRRHAVNDDPVQRVTWYEAAEFCNQLSRRDAADPYYVLELESRGERGERTYRVRIPDVLGAGYRLPTEAEWECACRAGSSSAYCFGDSEVQLGQYAWYYLNSGGEKTRKVGQARPNDFALFDMHGNVAEWCHDWYEESYGGSETVVNPLGPVSGMRKVVRGGSYIFPAGQVRSASRHHRPPAYSHRALGMRVARYLTPDLQVEQNAFPEDKER